MTQLLLHAPVYHAGHRRLLDQHPDVEEVLLLGDGFAERFPAMRKEIRGLDATTVGRILALEHGVAVRVVQPADLPAALDDVVLAPDEAVTRELAADHPGVRWRLVPVFLRWDRQWATEERPAGATAATTTDPVHVELMRQTMTAGDRSSDWWRQVGALAARDGQVLATAHNRHQPTEHAPYVDGDPRNEFSRGLRADLSTAIHAEASLVGQAAAGAFDTAGADIYVSAFPCPACAYLVAEARFGRCFFRGSYSLLDAEQILAGAGVELVWVDLTAAGGLSAPS
jgi:deoxycytidylate deaminase